MNANTNRFVGTLMSAQSEPILNVNVSCSGIHSIPKAPTPPVSENNR